MSSILDCHCIVGQTIRTNKLHRLGGRTVDTISRGTLEPLEVYGPILTQVIAGGEGSQRIADNYSWFANEAFWTAECGRKFGKPQEGDDKDPVCGDEACADPGTAPGETVPPPPPAEPAPPSPAPA